jgi:TonB family protein
MSTSIYAQPVAPRIVWRPVLATLMLHALVIYLMSTNWLSQESRQVQPKSVSKVIHARLVNVSELTPKKASKTKVKTRAKPKSRPKPKPKSKPVAKKPAQQSKSKPSTTPQPRPKESARPKPKPQTEPRLTAAELAAMARSELARAMEEDEQQQITATADQMVASYAALIQQTVTNYWSRPPSARNGMEALLAIQLIPTGEVVNVILIKSSGNTAFDRSAINAVEKAGHFPELKNLPTREFEKTFRRFRLLFKPEDLRY